MLELGTRAARAVVGVVATAVLLLVLAWFAPPAFYPWLKAAHVIAVMAWMAGMLYLPRLFVYHCAAEPGSPGSETFKLMERRLLRAIINPAMVVSWGLGLWLAWRGGLFAAGWSSRFRASATPTPVPILDWWPCIGSRIFISFVDLPQCRQM
jgi:putative membrane protein